MATPFVDLSGGCEKILRQMQDIAKNNYAFSLGRKTGMIDFLLDPSNGSIKLDLNNTQVGKKFVKSKVVYKVRTKPCEILEDSEIDDVCSTATEPEELSVDVTINKRIGTPVKGFTNSNMINICQDTQSFVQEYVMSDIKALREKASEFLLAQADAAIGVNVHQNGDTPTAAGDYKTKQILGTSSDTGTTVPLFANYSDFLLDYQNNQLAGVPALIGEGNLQKFMTLSGFSCCNADSVAYDAAIAKAGAAFYLDQAANSVLGANKVLMVAPNTLHLLWFNKNHNINIDSPTIRHIVIPDPVYPQLKWDLDFKWDECDEQWKYRISTYLDLFQAIRSDSFGEEDASSPACEDSLLGVTGVFGYTATSA